MAEQERNKISFEERHEEVSSKSDRARVMGAHQSTVVRVMRAHQRAVDYMMRAKERTLHNRPNDKIERAREQIVV